MVKRRMITTVDYIKVDENWNLEKTVTYNRSVGINYNINNVIKKYVKTHKYSIEDEIFLQRAGIKNLDFIERWKKVIK